MRPNAFDPIPGQCRALVKAAVALALVFPFLFEAEEEAFRELRRMARGRATLQEVQGQSRRLTGIRQLNLTCAGVLALLTLVQVALFCCLLYRGWRLIPPERQPLPRGVIIALLFVPGVHLYAAGVGFTGRVVALRRHARRNGWEARPASVLLCLGSTLFVFFALCLGVYMAEGTALPYALREWMFWFMIGSIPNAVLYPWAVRRLCEAAHDVAAASGEPHPIAPTAVP